MAESPPAETKIETTSAVIENSTTIERSSIEATNVTGRTLWDAVVDLARQLGPYTPWLLMIGGGIFAFFKFTELQQTAQSEARKDFQKDLDAAHKELRETFNQIADMNKHQLINVKSMLEVHEQTVKSTEEQRKKYNDLREISNKERDEVEKSRQIAERAKLEATDAMKNAQDASKRASEAAARVERAEKDLVAKEAELNRKSDEMNQRATKIGDLNQKLIELATLVVSPSGENDTLQLAKNILRDFSPDTKNLLKGFAEQPTKSAATMLKNLIGKGAQELAAGLKEGLGFLFWKQLSDPKKPENKIYVGVVRQSESEDENVVVIRVVEEQIVEVDCFEKLFVVSAPDTRNWNQSVSYLVIKSFSGDEGGEIEPVAHKGRDWTLAQTFEGALAQLIYGDERPLPIVSIPDARRRDAPLLDQVAENTVSDFDEAFAMFSKSEKFDANTILNSSITIEPQELRELLVDLLNASVAHKTSVPRLTLGYGLNDSEVLGAIAAVVLKPSFAFISAPKVKRRTISQSTAPEEREDYSVISRYYGLNQIKRSRIALSRDPQGKEWILTAFEDPYVSSDKSDSEYGQDYGFTSPTPVAKSPNPKPKATLTPKPSVTPKPAATPKVSSTPNTNSTAQPRKTP
jgi:hypothetical protein